MREEAVFDGEGGAEGPLMVSDVDWDEEVVYIHLPHILACHYHRLLLLWLLLNIMRMFTSLLDMFSRSSLMPFFPYASREVIQPKGAMARL